MRFSVIDWFATLMIQSSVMNTKFIEDLNARIVSFLQHTPAAEIQENLKAALTASLSRLDLVTREEFDVQSRVLAKTREKLGVLEARVAALEQPRQSDKA